MTTATTIATKAFSTETTGKPAPRRGNDLFLKIEVERDQATIDCGGTEHAGNHKARKVIFLANQDCILKFPNEKIFNSTRKQLRANVETSASIGDNVGSVAAEATYCEVMPIGAAEGPGTEHLSPPQIVVP